MQNPGEMILVLMDFNRHVGKRIDGFEGMHGRYGIAKEMFRDEDCSSFAMKTSRVWQTRGLKRKNKKKLTYSMGGDETLIDVVLFA